jgi:SAM-dependent methyltransferase
MSPERREKRFILDIGCGLFPWPARGKMKAGYEPGAPYRRLARNEHYIGVDEDPRALHSAAGALKRSQWGRRFARRVHLLQANALHHLPFADASMHEVHLHSMNDPRVFAKVIPEAARILKPDGQLLLSAESRIITLEKVLDLARGHFRPAGQTTDPRRIAAYTLQGNDYLVTLRKPSPGK